MRKLFALLIISFMAVGSLPTTAHARVFVSVGIGGGGYYPGYYGPHYYPGYYPGYYYAPPVVYAQPPTVVYAAPAPDVVYATPSAMPANQTSPTFVDAYGRTCRQYQSATGMGTACLQPDGTWRSVQ